MHDSRGDDGAAGSAGSVAERVVDVGPRGPRLTPAEGENVMAAAARAGWSWPTTCGGVGDCGTCLSRVTAGLEYCTPPDPLERETLARVLPSGAGDPRWRLACRLTVTGQVSLTKRGPAPAVTP